MEQNSKFAIFHGFLLNLSLSVFMKFLDKMSRDNALIEQLGTFPQQAADFLIKHLFFSLADAFQLVPKLTIGPCL